MDLTQLIEEVRRLATIITGDSSGGFSLSDYDYNLRAGEREFWVEFFGFKSWTTEQDHTLVVKEVFRAVCYKYGIAFIDKTATGDVEE